MLGKISRLMAVLVIGLILIVGFLIVILTIRTSPLWSQEAAGWAQAFGTIAAIVGTWFVARHQQEHGQRVLQAEVLSADKKKAEACFEVAKDACVVLDNVAAQFREHANGAKLSVGSERIEDV